MGAQVAGEKVRRADVLGSRASRLEWREISCYTSGLVGCSLLQSSEADHTSRPGTFLIFCA